MSPALLVELFNRDGSSDKLAKLGKILLSVLHVIILTRRVFVQVIAQYFKHMVDAQIARRSSTLT